MSVKRKEDPLRHRAVVRWLVGLGLCGSALSCKFWYPQGAQALQEAVFGKDGRSVEAAFAAFEDSYGEAQQIEDAVAAFCEVFAED